MHIGWYAKGRFGRTLLMAFIVLGIAGCASSKVTYRLAGSLGASDLTADAGTSFSFRMPRSLVLLKPGQGETRLNASVIDPVTTNGWYGLPFNDGFYYQVRVLENTAGTIAVSDFQSVFGEKLKVFPVPSCAAALVEIGVPAGSYEAFEKKPLGAGFQAAATEYDYPSGEAMASLSPLYRAEPHRGWFIATKLNVVKYPNTQIVKSIGVAVEDHFAEALSILAGIAKKSTRAKSPPPYAAEEIAPIHSVSLTVADSRRIALAPLPKKGNISLHSICGADVVETGTATSLDFLKNAEAAMARAKELYEHWNR